MTGAAFYFTSTILLFCLIPATAEAQATGALKGMIQDPVGEGEICRAHREG